METTEKKNILERIKTWAIVGLFVICFFGFMVFSYQYKSLNEKYEKAIKEQVNYQELIDSLLNINEKNEDIILNLNGKIEILNTQVSNLKRERDYFNKKLKETQNVVSDNITIATSKLKENLENEIF